MGKPFIQELGKLSDTIKYLKNIDTSEFQKAINKLLSKALYIIGSGGSFSACNFAELLHQSNGSFGKAITPLESFQIGQTYNEANVLIISAGGRNKDILFSFDQSIRSEPEYIVNLCAASNTPLAARSKKLSISRTFEFPLPSGKDGFLATNSLVSFFILLAKAYNNDVSKLNFESIISKRFESELDSFLKNVKIKDATFNVLYGGWSKPVAIDLESKLTEAALANTLLADYRNFAHGRHHWFDKKRINSAIIAIVTPDEEYLAQKTLSILPKDIPVLVLKASVTGPVATIELLIKSFFLINKIGEIQSIDPGKPGVPEFGRKIYHLTYSSFYNKLYALKNPNDLFIQRKIKPISINKLTPGDYKKWHKSYDAFKKSITNTHFGGLILDYDRTICSDEDRLIGPTIKIKNELIRLLKAGFILGVVTGRGQSVRTDLKNNIDKKYWDKIIIGYYNGAQIGMLSNNSLPDTVESGDAVFLQIKKVLKDAAVTNDIDITCRPHQLTIEGKDPGVWNSIKPILYQKIMLIRNNNFMILESSRSMDIIRRPEVSKLNIIDFIKGELKTRNLAGDCLCIGDKGKWPGNDFELLSNSNSLSVNEVSLDPHSCWNVAPLGINNTDACYLYLKHLTLYKNHFKLHI